MELLGRCTCQVLEVQGLGRQGLNYQPSGKAELNVYIVTLNDVDKTLLLT